MKRQPASKLKIERGIPLVDAVTRPSYAQQLRKMKPGDSVLFKGISAGTVRKRGMAAFGAGNYAVRKVAGGVRLWRIK